MRFFIEVEPHAAFVLDGLDMKVGDSIPDTGMVEVSFDEEAEYLRACAKLLATGARFFPRRT